MSNKKLLKIVEVYWIYSHCPGYPDWTIKINRNNENVVIRQFA